MSQNDKSHAPRDPLSLWYRFYEETERTLTEAVQRTLGTPAFAEASGKMLEVILTAQRSMREATRSYLETLNLPTREDLARLGELITALEEKIDTLEEKVDALSAQVAAKGAAGKERER